MLTIVLPVRMV